MCGGGKDDGQSPELRDAIKRKNKALDRYLREERRENDRRKPLWFAALTLVIIAMCGGGGGGGKDRGPSDEEVRAVVRRQGKSLRDYIDSHQRRNGDPKRFAVLHPLRALTRVGSVS